MIRSTGKRLKLVQELGAQVKPGFPCPPSCGECCREPIQILKVEWDAIKANSRARGLLDDQTLTGRLTFAEPTDEFTVRISDSDGHCPFLEQSSGACRIYEMRPFTCRAYGQSAMIPCKKRVACPPGLEVPVSSWQTWLKLAGERNDEVNLPVAELERRQTALVAWRAKSPERFCALPWTKEEVAEMHALRAPTSGVEPDERIP